jgi:hypothetical protein
MRLYDRILNDIRISSFDDYQYTNVMVLYNIWRSNTKNLIPSPAGFALYYIKKRRSNSKAFYHYCHFYSVLRNWIEN